MTVSYKDALEQARVFLREDGNRLTPNDWILICEQARQHFTRDKPQKVIADIAGTNAYEYQLTYVVGLPPSGLVKWVNHASRIISIEYPTGDQEPTYLGQDEFIIYRSDTATEKLRVLEQTFASGKTARLCFTAPHEFSETASSIYDTDRMLISLLIAAYGAQALVSDFLKINRSNLTNDSVDFSQKAKDMQELSDKLLKRYADMIEGGTEGVKQHYTFTKDFDMLTSFGEEYIVHDEGDR